MKKILRFITQRVVITALLIVLQVLLLFGFIWKLDNYFVYFYAGSVLLSLLITLGIINSKSNPAYKIAWLIPILLFPVFGGLVYLLFGSDRTGRYLRKKLQGIGTEMDNVIGEAHRRSGAEQLPPDAANQSRYISHCAYCPPYQNTTTEYLPLGEVKFERMVEELKKAKHYIFLEYFIIQEGKMWNTILDILRQKAAEGVDVRVIYDDAGCLSLLPHNYAEMMRADGIRAFSFNRCVPMLNLVMNNRDHRKIMVIDGQIAFTGGVNLADEYINKIVRFGYWKDSGVRLDGPGAASLANIFLTFWKAKYPDEDLDAGCDLPAAVPVETDCLVQPFADSPVDREAVAKNVYLELINQAQKRLYICTPYLILDNDLLSCLRLAAKRGVDVRIYTPGVPDKPTIYQLTRSYFPHLLRAGVKIYSYTPGFLHAKTWLVDDRIAAVGTVNLVYRSLYLHFENSVLLYGGAVLDDVRRDLAEIEKESAAVTLADCRTGFFGTLYSAVLRLVAPLC